MVVTETVFLTETQEKILEAFGHDDETAFFYRYFQEKLNLSRPVLKREMNELRKCGYVALIRGLISDDAPGYRGSGWQLTTKGKLVSPSTLVV